ncbi:site-specific integrase [Pseudomonas aeruginosa]|uniref:site-specific integrase n=1 Tax=Pseudomonas aeruginosa TaxID=287 RepID=UPI001E47FB31|nr:site-specific integrase [Pseudomonas aeruginosa]
MTLKSGRRESLPGIFSLPTVSRTKSGIEFHPREDIWQLREAASTICIKFKKLRAHPELLSGFKVVLLWYFENYAADTCRAYFHNFKHFCERISDKAGQPLGAVGSEEILNYKASLSSRQMGRLGSLSVLFRKWRSLGVPGVSGEAVKLLEGMRISGAPKGISVLTHDPIDGPLNDLEFDAVVAGVKKAFDSQRITLESYVLAMLFIALGQRPVQYATLKVCDVMRGAAADGGYLYSLSVPRAKQKGGFVREQFKNRLLNSSLGVLLWSHAKSVEKRFEDVLADATLAPLFPATVSRYNEPLGFEFHRTGQSISDAFTAIIDSLRVISVRTGERINVHPYRFRRTTGSRAAVEGHGELVIAELLDHTDTQNVGVYVQSVPEIVERIDRALALHLAPLAQAFAGKIIPSEEQATRHGDSASRICDPRFNPTLKPMGNCGSYGFCGALAPIACYTCQSFEPWLDGPHEAVLEYLIAERERILANSNMRIASINDRTILAVAEVVIRCKKMVSLPAEVLDV